MDLPGGSLTLMLCTITPCSAAVALTDHAHFIRTTAASVVDWLYRGIGPENWPEALTKLLQMAESQDKFAQEVSCSAKRLDLWQRR